MTVGDGLRGQVQFLAADHYPPWPVETATIERRYADVAPARLATLTLEAFVVAKAAAWTGRRALWTCTTSTHSPAGAIDAGAADLFRRLGPTGNAPGAWTFDVAPDEEVWRAALGHQCRSPPWPRKLYLPSRAWAAADG